MTLLPTVLDLILSISCAGCGAVGSECCPACFATLTSPAPVVRCPTAASPVYALARYSGPARRLVLAYKERGRRELAGRLGAALAAALPYLPSARTDSAGRWWLVPAPSRRVASRVRGGPHLLRLARACAAALAGAGHAVAVAPALRLCPGARDAVGLDRKQRMANLAGRIRLDPRGLPPPGTPVVLLDDVITTGATAGACTRVLHEGGIPVTAVLTLTSAG